MQEYIYVNIKAEAVVDNGNGTFNIKLPTRELKPEEHRVLESLFPNLNHKAYELLSKEAILEALASEADVSKPPLNRKASDLPEARRNVKPAGKLPEPPTY